MTKKAYTVTSDVEWVNGRKVPAERIVYLTNEEAAFDLGLGRLERIELEDEPEDRTVTPDFATVSTAVRSARKRGLVERS